MLFSKKVKLFLLLLLNCCCPSRAADNNRRGFIRLPNQLPSAPVVVTVGPSVFVFAGTCATIGLVYKGIQKLAEHKRSISIDDVPEELSEGWKLIIGGIALGVAVIGGYCAHQRFAGS